VAGFVAGADLRADARTGTTGVVVTSVDTPD
jgi:hypothetical protein